LMAPPPSSLRTSFRALSITRIEIKESVIYDGRRQGLVERKAGFTLTLICTLQSNVASDWFVGEHSLILVSPRGYLITLSA
jgi:hypothetical protein